jgi:hypothetical protein
MYPIGKQLFRLFQFSAAIGRQAFSSAVNKIGEHPQARSGTFGRNLLRRERSCYGRSTLCEQAFRRMRGIRLHCCDPSFRLASGHMHRPSAHPLRAARVRAAFCAALLSPALPFVRTASSAARLRLAAPRRWALERAWRERAVCDAACRPSR